MQTWGITKFCLLFFVEFWILPGQNLAEGTKQTTPDSACLCELFLCKLSSYVDPFGVYSADSDHSIHFTIKNPGEKLYFGLGELNTPGDYLRCRIVHNGNIVWGEVSIPEINGQPGFIVNYLQAIAGPNVINPAGYNPLIFSPSEAGDYIIQFDFINLFFETVFYYDFTIIDTTLTPYKSISGGVWSKNWEFAACYNSSQSLFGLNASLFILTNDSIVDSVEFNQFYSGIQNEYNFNHNGCLYPPVAFNDSRKSRLYHFDYPEYRVFFNDPDSTLFPSGTIGKITHGYSELIPDCLGQYEIIFKTTKSGIVQVLIKVNPVAGIQPEDVIIWDSVPAGTDTIIWNGVNGLGVPVPLNSPVNIHISFINGLTNFPIYNIYSNVNGLLVGMNRPVSFQPLQYWNDTLIPMGQIQIDGCLSSLGAGCHTWQGSQFGGFGAGRTLNTWWYSAYPDSIINASLLFIVATPDSIQGAHTLCFAANQNYTYTVYPNPLPGAQTYQWSLFKGMNLLQSWNTTTVTINTVSFPDTGHYVLSVKGRNNCGVGNSKSLTIIVFPPDTAMISISSSANQICTGTPVRFTATPSNGGLNPAFQWKVNGINVGTNSPAYTYTPVNGDLISCILTSSNTVCISNNPATSNTITMVVNPNLPVSVSVSPSANPVCAGTSVTYNATPINGGTLPTYQWKINGINMGGNGSTYTYSPSNGDLVICVLTSSEVCTTNNPATSSPVIMVINSNLVIGVSIAASANPVCAGTSVTFTATPTNGGLLPTYQWKVNGINVGANSPNYTYNPASGDLVSCILNSSLPCTSNNPSTSNSLSIIINPPPVVTFIACFDTIMTVNAKPFKLKGGIPLGGTYSGPGVNPVSGIWNPAAAGTGTIIITYSYTNVALCSAIAHTHLFNFPFSIFNCGSPLTDIRDNQVYQTVQIGAQCWMAENLNYGTMIPGSMNQRDNCLNEKYCNNDLTADCGLRTYYQWDEIMQYDNTPGLQGLCPPGWHIPTEADWNQLFAVYNGPGFAGSQLLSTGFSGFNALVNGSRFQNSSWNFDNFAIHLWSSSAWGPVKAWAHAMNNAPDDHSVSTYPSWRSNAFSARCVKD